MVGAVAVLLSFLSVLFFFFFQGEDGIRAAQESRGLGDVYKRQVLLRKALNGVVSNKIRQKEKHPFTLSTCQVFDAGWTKLVSKTLSEESVRQRGWFNPLEAVSYTHLTLPTIYSV